MDRSRAALLGIALFLGAPPLHAAQDPPAQPPATQQPPAVQEPAPLVREIRVTGAHELSRDVIVDAARVRSGEPLPIGVDRIDDLAARIVRHYRDEGYTFANVKAAFDTTAGVLSFTVDEGVIGGVEFTGVDDQLKRRFADEFAMRAGDVFNRS